MKTSITALLVLLAVSASAAAQQYSVTSVKRSVSDIDPNAGVKTRMHDLGTLGGSRSQGNSINANGQIAGQAYTANDAALHAFLYAGGKMLDLGTFGGSISQGRSINARGEVAGVAYTKNNAAFRAFVYRDGSMHDLGALGGAMSQANSINDSGQVTGYAQTNDNAVRAFLYTGGKMVDLNTQLSCAEASRYTLISGEAIDDSGQIIAEGYVNATGSNAAFLLSPTGRPSIRRGKGIGQATNIVSLTSPLR